jgi:predicted amidohydrolase
MNRSRDIRPASSASSRARNGAQGSCNITRRGDILAWNEGDHDIIEATIPPASYRFWAGGDLSEVTFLLRRPHLCGAYTLRSDFMKSSFASLILRFPCAVAFSPRDQSVGCRPTRIASARICILGVLLLCWCGAFPLFAAKGNLLADSGAWRVATPFKPVGLKFESSPALKISSHGKAGDIGGWMRPLAALAKGRRYRFEAAFSVEGIAAPQRHVWALVTNGGREFLEFVSAEKEGGRHRLSLEFTPEKDLPRAELRLYLADTASGSVTWESATVEDITATYQPRRVRLAAISGKPTNPTTSAEAVGFYLAKLDQIAGLGLDLVCLPETINVDGVRGDGWTILDTIPGTTTQRLAEKARRYHVYIAAGIAEHDGGVRYNTAVLIDRRGELVAKYRKSHLTIEEHLLMGITEGNEFVVHQTDFGKVGLMVCWDQHFPEVPRILALKGADILVLPNAGDGREKGSLWEPAMRLNAAGNHVAIVSAVNSGLSMIVGPDGTILARNERRSTEIPGVLIYAVCELDDSVANYTGQPINKRYLLARRPEIYEAVIRDLDGDLKAGMKEGVTNAR